MKALRYLTLLMALIVVQGCAKQAIVEEDRIPELPPDGPAPVTSNVDINPDDFDDYLTKRVAGLDYNSIEFGMRLRKIGDGYGGFVRFGFSVNGEWKEVYQESKDPRKRGYLASEVEYNTWVNSAGERYWHGFFQDRVGAVVVVIEETVGGPTGDNPYDRRLRGSIWYKHFTTGPQYNPTQGYLPCWKIEIGPFDCRTFLVERPRSEWGEHEHRNSVLRYKVDTHSDVYPRSLRIRDVVGGVDHGTRVVGDYIRLGTFEGLRSQDVFNE